MRGGCGEVGVGRWVWGGGCGEVGVGRWMWGDGCGEEVDVGRWYGSWHMLSHLNS